jgi:hypothetical protein
MPKLLKIDEIYYFGLDGLDLETIRSNMAVLAGDELDSDNPYWLQELQDRIRQSVREATGKEATDVAFVSFNGRNVVYVGLPGASVRSRSYNATPREEISLNAEVVDLYEGMLMALATYHSGSAEAADRYTELYRTAKQRAAQMPELIARVLNGSSSAAQRRVAAKLLGMVANEPNQINALVQASFDEDRTVRNNAVSSLTEIAESEHSEQLPASIFMDMLNSGIWTDRNKASCVLVGITRMRKRELLQQLRLTALTSLKEMAQWDLLHASPALVLIGRINGIAEDQLEALIASKRIDEIVNQSFR